MKNTYENGNERYVWKEEHERPQREDTKEIINSEGS
jgi:hypothetical protein